MSRVLLIFMIFSVSSCSLFKSKPPQEFELLAGEEAIGKRTQKEIEKELSIYESLAMNTFKVRIFPVIPEYISKFKKQDEMLTRIPSPEDKTCFVAEIVSDSYNPKAIDFKNWKAEGMDFQDDLIHMTWTEDSLNSQPQVTEIPSYHGKQKRFKNRGILCAVDKIETARFFQVKLSPQIVQWPLKGDMVFNWRVPYKTIENGEVVIKKRKKKVQRYKGW